MSRINEETDNICPDCGHEPHDTCHVFSCPKKATSLTPDSIWHSPREAAVFLGLEVETSADDENNEQNNGDD